MPKYPCRNCLYFKVCGDNTRTRHCDGRKTKTDAKKEKTAMNGESDVILSSESKLYLLEIAIKIYIRNAVKIEVWETDQAPDTFTDAQTVYSRDL